MAWEVRSPWIRQRDRVALGAAVFAGIGLVKVIGSNLPDLALLHSIPMAFVIIALPILAVKLMQTHDRRRRVTQRVPSPVGVVLDYSPGRIVERREGQREVVAFGRAGLRNVIDGQGHVFLSNGTDVVIVPDRAFSSAAARADFSRHWRALVD